MPAAVQTCPKCGALIVPQLVRCRQCKTYLHGTEAEGFIFEKLLPQGAAKHAGTAVLSLLIILFYLFMVVACFGASPASAFGFSGFSLVQLGATHGPSILLGDYWRFITSIFAHHDLMHVAFNLWALSSAGPIVEEIFDKKKMLLMYLVAGTVSMAVSFVWYVYFLGQVTYVSAGASGAVSGMIGAALFGARRLGPAGADVARGMTRWAVYMVAWGLLMPGINNAAHAGGFVMGSLLAHKTPLGLVKSVPVQRVLSVAMLGLLALFVASTVMMVSKVRGFPAALERDAESRGIFGMVYYRGAPFQQSDQVRVWTACVEPALAGVVTPEAVAACELNVRVNDHDPQSYRILADLLGKRGDSERARRLEYVARLIEGKPGA